MIYGLTPSVNKNHIIRAALESIAFQIKDYLDDLEKNQKIICNDIYIDGGIVSNLSFMNFLSDTLKRKIYVTNFEDMSSYGSLIMGLLGTKIEKNLKDISKYKQKYTIYHPNKNKIIDSYKKWKDVLNNFYL